MGKTQRKMATPTMAVGPMTMLDNTSTVPADKMATTMNSEKLPASEGVRMRDKDMNGVDEER